MTREYGAKARTNNHQPCGQAAMANGRCRLHGGVSTGPKTEVGKDKSRQAVLKHGFYTKAAIEERRQLRLMLRDSKDCLNDFTEKLRGKKARSIP
jgi:hypothetical protein